MKLYGGSHSAKHVKKPADIEQKESELRKHAVEKRYETELYDENAKIGIIIKTYPSKPADDKSKKRRWHRSYGKIIGGAIALLLIASIVAAFLSTLWRPVLRIYGTAMSPTLVEGEVVWTQKGSSFEKGDIIAFYYNDKVLVKRIIAQAGDRVAIDDKGKVYVNEVLISEPYITENAVGECSIVMPYTVPEGKVFVMGDNRAVSLDSRSSKIGCVSEEQIIGKIIKLKKA